MGKKGNKRKTRWRVFPIGGEDVEYLYSANEDEIGGDQIGSPPTAINGPCSYARVAHPGRGNFGTRQRLAGFQSANHNRPNRSTTDKKQPIITTEKKTFNEEEYTKITTPRQDVLFKKGYLGRKKTVSGCGTTTLDATAATDTEVSLADASCIDLASIHNGGDCVLSHVENEGMNPADEQQFMCPNGYMDGVVYVNGGYDWYDPYNNVTVLVGPTSPFAGPVSGPPMLAAMPCQPLPLQPLQWFNPAFGVPFMAPTLPSCHQEEDHQKRCSTNSQNCSPQSSISTDPLCSTQEGEGEYEVEGDCEGETENGIFPELAPEMNKTDEYSVYSQAHSMQSHPLPQPQTYMYPSAYVFGQPIYNMNGMTVQSASQLPQNTDNSGSKRRKKKRRRRRRHGGVDGSEETSSDEKYLEDPVSLTSQGSSQEVELDSKSSCPTVLGRPKLLETVAKPSLSSPSSSPSLSSSPSPTNILQNKTALTSTNLSDTNILQRNEYLRSGLCSDNADSLGNLLVQSVDVNTLQSSHIPNNEIIEVNKTEKLICETSVEHQNFVEHNGSLNINSMLLHNEGERNGNHIIECSTEYELDNNFSEANDFVQVNSKDSNSVTVLDEKCAMNEQVQLPNQNSASDRVLNLEEIVQHGSPNSILDSKINNGFLNDKETRIEKQGSNNVNCGSPTFTKNVCMQENNNNNISPDKSNKCHPTSSMSSETPSYIPGATTQQQISCVSESMEQPILKVRHSSNFSVDNEEENIVLQKLILSDLNAECHSNGFSNEGSLSADECVSLTKVPKEINGENINYESDEENKLSFADTNLTLEITPSENAVKEDITQDESDDTLTTSNTIKCTQMKPLLESKSLNQTNTSETQLKSEGSQEIPSNNCNLYVIEDPYCLQELCDSKDEVEPCTSPSVSKNSSEQNTLTPPVPPPRRKRWQLSRWCSVEHPLTPNQPEKKDDVPNQSSRCFSQSKESATNLMKSRHCDIIENPENILPNNRLLFDSTFLTSENILFHKPEDVTSISREPALASDNYKCKSTDLNANAQKLECHECNTSDNADTSVCNSEEQVLKGDQRLYKHSETEDRLLSNSAESFALGQESCDKKYKSYDAHTTDLPVIPSEDTMVSIPSTTQSLSLTEAVTKWLQSQDSKELLLVPRQLSETDSEVEEMKEEEIMTDQKNVHRNPLLALSCEITITYDSAGIRVAILQNSYPRFHKKENSCKKVILLHDNFIDISDVIIEKPFVYLERIKDVVDSHEKEDAFYLFFLLMYRPQLRQLVFQNKYDTDKLRESTAESTSVHKYIPKFDIFVDNFSENGAWVYNQNGLKMPTSAMHILLQNLESAISSLCNKTSFLVKYFMPDTRKLLPTIVLNHKEKVVPSGCGSDCEEKEEIDKASHLNNTLMNSSQTRNTYRCSLSKNLTRKSKNILYSVETTTKCEMNCVSSLNTFTTKHGIHSEKPHYKNCCEVRNERPQQISELNILKGKSAFLLSRLVAENPLSCGGICCVLQ